MGDGPTAGAFKLAFMVPNPFRRLLGEGALTAAFIPIFKEKERAAGEAEMWRSANAVISGLIVAASAIIGIVLLGISLVLLSDSPETLGGLRPARDASAEFEVIKASFPAPGWLSPDTRLMLKLLRVMFPYMLLVCLRPPSWASEFAGFSSFSDGAGVLNGILIITVL